MLSLDEIELLLVALKDVDDHLEMDLNDTHRNLTQLFSARLLLDQVRASSAIVTKWKWALEAGYKCCERCGLGTPTSALRYTNTTDDRLMCPRCHAWAEEQERFRQEDAQRSVTEPQRERRTPTGRRKPRA